MMVTELKVSFKTTLHWHTPKRINDGLGFTYMPSMPFIVPSVNICKCIRVIMNTISNWAKPKTMDMANPPTFKHRKVRITRGISLNVIYYRS